jgi:hypothetical protein
VAVRSIFVLSVQKLSAEDNDMLVPVMLWVALGSPYDLQSSVVTTRTDNPWALSSFVNTSVEYTCSDIILSVYNYSRAEESQFIGGDPKLWQTSYTRVQKAISVNSSSVYIIAHNYSENRFISVKVCQDEPSSISNLVSHTEVYKLCGGTQTYSPTAAPAVIPPTYQSRTGPSGPSKFAECAAQGGGASFICLNSSIQSHLPDLYAKRCILRICNVTQCNGVFTLYDTNGEIFREYTNVCPAAPWETPVRDNEGVCYFITTDYYSISSTCCVTTSGCPASAICPNVIHNSLGAHDCTGFTYPPTFAPTAAPTTSPTAVPTSSPSLDSGPATETECTDAGGTGWYQWEYLGVSIVRYCCGVAACTESYKDGVFNSCACHATPGEIQIRNNPQDCGVCISGEISAIVMVYCPGTPGCDGQYAAGCTGYLYDACTDVYGTSAPTFAPTFAPTGSPTRGLALNDPCWTYDLQTQQCLTVSNLPYSNWCQVPATFYRVAEYVIDNTFDTPVINGSDRRPATRVDAGELDSDDREDAFLNLTEIISEAQDMSTSGACWCLDGSITRRWFPFGMVEYVSVDTPTFVESGSGRATELPRDYYPVFTIPVGIMLTVADDVPFSIVVIVNASGTFNKTQNTASLYPSESECEQLGCNYEVGNITLDEFSAPVTVCRFICVSVYALTNVDTSEPLPNTIASEIGPTNITECVAKDNFVWLQQQPLVYMSTRFAWQRAHDVLNTDNASTTRIMWVPWMDLPSGESSLADNCPIIGMSYCSVNMTYYESLEEYYCALNAYGGDITTNNSILVNYVGLGDMAEIPTCPVTSGTTVFRKVAPLFNLYLLALDENDYFSVRRYLYNIFWDTFATRTFAYLESCSETRNYSVILDSGSTMYISTDSFDYVYNDSAICYGLDGCGNVPNVMCANVPGCVLKAGVITSTTTTTTFSIPRETLGPTTQEQTPTTINDPNEEHALRLTLVAIGGITIVAMIVLLILKHQQLPVEYRRVEPSRLDKPKTILDTAKTR